MVGVRRGGVVGMSPIFGNIVANVTRFWLFTSTDIVATAWHMIASVIFTDFETVVVRVGP